MDSKGELDHKLQFLYRAAQHYSTRSPLLSNHLSSRLSRIGLQQNISFSKTSNLCVKCSTFLIPGLNSCINNAEKAANVACRSQSGQQKAQSGHVFDGPRSNRDTIKITRFIRGFEPLPSSTSSAASSSGRPLLDLGIERKRGRRSKQHLVIYHCHACGYGNIYSFTPSSSSGCAVASTDNGQAIASNPNNKDDESIKTTTVANSAPSHHYGATAMPGASASLSLQASSMAGTLKKKKKKVNQLAQMLKLKESRQEVKDGASTGYSLDDFLA